MNNDELKKKIATIIDSEFENRCRKTNCHNCDLYPDEMCQPNMYADVLIAAGIGDVKESENKATAAEIVAQAAASTAIEKIEEWKHRAEVAERALKNRAISHVSKCFPNEISGLESCVQEVYEAWIYQAEKELAEEGKDD